MATPTIPRPGVKVFQEFQTTSPTVVVPSLPPVIVGVAKQVVEAVQDDGSLNSSTFTTLPARIAFPFVTDPFQYTGVGATTLELSINNGPTVTITFPAGDLTPEEIKAHIDSQSIPGLVVVTEESGLQKRTVLETSARGQFAKLEVVGGTMLALTPLFDALGDGGLVSIGLDGYNNAYVADLLLSDYPDPRSNLSELDIDFDTVRLFLDTGNGSFREILKSQAFLRGATDAVSVFDDGDGDNLSPYIDIASATMTASAAAAAVTDTVVGTFPGSFEGLSLDISVDGGSPQRITFSTGVANMAALAAEINAVLGQTVASDTAGDLVLTSPTVGAESSINILSTSSSALLTALGAGFAAGLTEGTPFPVAVGDALWVDGVQAGLVTEVVSDTRIRLDSEKILTFTGSRYYFVALADMDNAAATSSRPSSELVVDVDSGTIKVARGVFRDTAGVPTAASSVGLYLGYTALRQDVSAASEDFTMVRSGSLTDLQAQLEPIDTQNPLGLGMYFAQLNAPGIEVQGLGVDEASDTEPEGTLDGWGRAYEYLESKDVYAIAQLTHSLDVAHLAAAHVTAMSDPENGLERVVITNPSRPARVSNTLIASGALGNATAATSVFNTSVPNLPALIAAAGLGVGPYTIADNLFLELEQDTNKYLITAVSGSQVTLSVGALAGNTDTFYFDDAGPAFASAIVDRPFSVAIRGAAVANLTEEATAYADIARGFANRRVVCMAPDKVKATIDGLETLLEGYYAGAALAGLTASKSPQDPLTNVGLTGFTGVQGSNDRYSELQLKIMDGGGLWVLIQEADGQPVITRHQLTTDMSSIEKREYSITTAVDFTAKFVRQALKNFIGRFNITTGVKDSVNSVLDGIGKYLVEQGAVQHFTINSLRQDEAQPDRLIIDVNLGVLYPLNEIQVTLVI